MLQVILIFFFFRLFRFFWILMVMLKVQAIHSRCCVFLVYSIQAIVNLEDPVIRPCRTHLTQVREKPWDRCRHSLIANALSVGLRISLALPLQDCESQIFPVKDMSGKDFLLSPGSEEGKCWKHVFNKTTLFHGHFSADHPPNEECWKTKICH